MECAVKTFTEQCQCKDVYMPGTGVGGPNSSRPVAPGIYAKSEVTSL